MIFQGPGPDRRAIFCEAIIVGTTNSRRMDKLFVYHIRLGVLSFERQGKPVSRFRYLAIVISWQRFFTIK